MHLVKFSMTLMVVRGFDDDVAAHDIRAEPIKTLRQFPHARFYSGRRLHLPKSDLQR
jgi:hypothetical protein